MAGLKNSCDGFAYAIDFKDGGYVLNITNAAAILARNEVTGKIEFDLNRCPPLCPNLPYAEINVTIPIADGTEPAIMRMQSGPKGDLWIREDGPNHRWIFFERGFIFYLQHVHTGLMLLAQDYLSLQDRLKSAQRVLDE